MGFLGSLAGGLLGAGSSVVQNSQNRQNVRETNQMNYKINQMNNQFNERMAIQQRNWQEDMWNKENAYNTASAQRQRLEEAGLNPYLMMNGGSAGVAQSAGTGASASSSVCDAKWPVCNEEYLVEDTVNYTISFNGKARFNMEFPADAASDVIQTAVLADERSEKWIEGKTIAKVIVVPKKIVNIVVK